MRVVRIAQQPEQIVDQTPLVAVDQVAETVPITPQDRVAAVDDLRYWRAGAVILDPRLRQAGSLHRGMTELTGVRPTFTGGVWLWDVRPLVD